MTEAEPGVSSFRKAYRLWGDLC